MSQQFGSPSHIYRITIRSILDEGWVRALQINPIATHRHYAGPPRTILTLHVRDQAELLGLFNQLHNMGLTILAFQLSMSDAPEERTHDKRLDKGQDKERPEDWTDPMI
jgi:hypothetical protein